MKDTQPILVSGTTGYIGGRLVPRLLDEGYQVRILTRNRQQLQGRRWLKHVKVIQVDFSNDDTLREAFSGIDKAYYLIPKNYDSKTDQMPDLLTPKKFGQAAKENGLKSIITIGELGTSNSSLSNNIQKQSIGDALRESGLPVTEFRTAVIVGCGSTLFEIVRYVTERLPITLLPQWSYSRIQPIATCDVMDYLIAALVTPSSEGKIIEIGGPDVLSMSDMMRIYAEVRGLRRWMIPVPALPPRLSSYWIHWITPIPARVALPLIENLRQEVSIQDGFAQQQFPDIHPMDFRSSVKYSLDFLDAGQIETSWRDSLSTALQSGEPVALTSQEGMIFEQRQRQVAAPPETVFKIISKLGGDEGWLYYDWAWKLRGIMDRMVGGVGLQRGRRDPQDLRVGDAVDVWRVETLEPNRLVRFRAEMKLPGRAWLQFETHPQDESGTNLRLTAFFAPKGLSGWIYWYIYYPAHKLIFPGLIRKIAERAESAF